MRPYPYAIPTLNKDMYEIKAILMKKILLKDFFELMTKQTKGMSKNTKR